MPEHVPPHDPKVLARSLAQALGQRVADLRLRRGWTQKELGLRPGVSYGNVRAIEGGDAHFPRLDTLVALAVALGVDSLDDLFAASPTFIATQIEAHWSQSVRDASLAEPA